MSELYELSRPFSDRFISRAPGGHGDYVSHPNVTQRALSVVGPFSFEVVELIRGFAEEMKGKEQTWPEREGAVVGCLARLTCTVDGKEISVVEVGDVDQPAMNNDGRNAKDAASDALKRCWMRVGLGLHLWAGADYFLDAQLHKQESDEGPAISSESDGTED